MASLSSRPSIPAPRPQIIFVPQPVTTSVSSTDAGGSSATDPVDPAQSASEARTRSLLSRNRGRFGTVQTSFRGLLGLSDSSGQRKSLLGE